MDESLLKELRDTNVEYMKELPTPRELREEVQTNDEIGRSVLQSRETIENILHGKDSRIIGMMGPCSIHDYDSAIEYAQKVSSLQERVKDQMFLVMRVYPEKPRTTTGWEGFIPEPDINGVKNYGKGLKLTRQLLIEIAKLDVPATMEAMGGRSIQYIDELTSHASTGARTVEDMSQRKINSLLSFPVGLKNNTEGNIESAVNGVETAIYSSQLPGMDDDGKLVEVGSYGNPNVHVILRGGQEPNYHKEYVQAAISALKERGLPSKVIVDCNHGNSQKDHTKQPEILQDVIDQIVEYRKEGENDLVGFMLESHHKEGKQKLPSPRTAYTRFNLDPYLSITDPCISWETTESTVLDSYEKLKG